MKIKNLLLVMLCITMSSATFGQTKEKEITQAEEFSSKAGTLIEKQFIEIGKVKGVEIKVLKYKDLNTGASKSALRFEYEYKSNYTASSKIASLDSDEIEGLIKSIKNLQTNVFPSTRDTYTEITFRSRTGFEAGAYFTPGKDKWTTYLQLDRYDRNSLVFLNQEDFTVLLDLVEKAKVLM